MLLAAKLAGPTGRVIAVEPDPSNFAQLTRNRALNGATNVQPHRVVVGGADGRPPLLPKRRPRGTAATP